MAVTNVEIKARSEKNDVIEKILLEEGAEFKGEDHQIDTYFEVSQGRLKLRKGNIEHNIIYYERGDRAGPKISNILLSKQQDDSLALILKKVLPVKVVVDKRRKIFFIKNVKFHLDTVETLGSFMEIEAIDRDGSISREQLQEQCEYYMETLGIQEEDLLTQSYSDMLLTQKGGSKEKPE